METRSSILPGESPWTEEPGRLQSRDCLENPHGQRSLAGYRPGVTESRTRLSD